MKVIDTDAPNIRPSAIMQILIVEDEYVIAANLQENLEALGYKVLDIASSGAEAIAAAVALRPDLVLMDIQLRGEMDGIQAAEQIWDQLSIPVIYVTGHSDKSTLERAKVTFPFGYVLKPVKGKELYVAIETALSRYEREQLLAAVLKSVGDGLIVTNTLGQILFLNRSAELLTGWQQSEARNRDLAEIFNVVYEDSRRPLNNVAVTAIQQDSIFFLNERMVLITKAGENLPVADSVAPIKNQKGLITGAVLLFRDDTQRRLQEEHNRTLEQTQLLQRQNEELERLGQLKDDFLSTVSHELRSPLTNIKMAIQMLEVTLNRQFRLNPEMTLDADDPDRLTRYLDILRDQCNKELGLVNDLLELQQIDAGLHPVEWVAIHLHDWILQGAAVFQDRAQMRDQQFQILVSMDIPVLISDLAILTRIFTELLTNACKYTPPDGEIIVSASAQPNNRVHLIVCNTGIEIPADELPRIFDKFYRIPAGDRWQQGGTGLGLALVKKAANYLGGTVWAESSTGQTRFIVELPLSPPDTVDDQTPLR